MTQDEGCRECMGRRSCVSDTKEKVVMAGDGQVTLEHTIMKHTAKKVRRIYHDKILAGFAGSTADAFTLFAKFEEKLEQYNGSLLRAAVELAKGLEDGPDTPKAGGASRSLQTRSTRSSSRAMAT